jgi:membrane protein
MMKIGAKEAFQLVKESAKDFSDDECPRMAAALAYYTVFALPPLLILILMIVGSFVSRDTVSTALSGQIGGMIGSEGARTIQTMITQAKQPGGGVVATILGLAAVVLGATGAFMQLQTALDRAWEVKPDPGSGGIRNFILKRVLSLGMVLGIAFLLLVSLALSAALSAVGSAIGALIPGASAVVVGVLQTLISLAVITLLFAAIFKVLPDAVIAWRDVWVGALVTGLLFEVGKWGIGLYLGHSNPGKAYGAASSLAVILVWIYYTAMIVLFGAEFTQTWAVRRGAGIRPEEGAVRVSEDTPGAGKAGGKEKEPSTGSRSAAATTATHREPGARDREPHGDADNETGQPGGGVGRREDVGGSGVHPRSAGTAPDDAEMRTPREWGEAGSGGSAE